MKIQMNAIYDRQADAIIGRSLKWNYMLIVRMMSWRFDMNFEVCVVRKDERN